MGLHGVRVMRNDEGDRRLNSGLKVGIGLLLLGTLLFFAFSLLSPRPSENVGLSTEPKTEPGPTKADFVIQLSTSGCWAAWLSYENEGSDYTPRANCGNRTFDYRGTKAGVRVRFDAGRDESTGAHFGVGSGTVSIYKNGVLCFSESGYSVEGECKV